MNKWFAGGLGLAIGLSHLGRIGIIANRGGNSSKLPSLDIPVGSFTTYEAEVSEEGYRIRYLSLIHI